ncbi:MAG: flagellar biosynthetic protein FliO [Lachnospiraceae bacterium]|jgi:flagellar protein FliO/FliZ|nr:flagellar biosynthetic protein FliO [Lachnospiraceae bacterium]MBR3573549.1 flagellar biosynthetic protein FliO [Lachnospiraceae bacterium]MCR5740799.1 flagellar biosynthetic protein FliO [Lachnospiraceae bacterium]
MILLTKSTLSDIAQLFTVLIIFIAVLVISMLCTKWIGNYQKLQASSGSAEVIETVRIAPGKWIQIVRIGSKYKVIAICKDTVTYLGDVDESDIKSGDSSEKKTFSEVLSKTFTKGANDSGGEG